MSNPTPAELLNILEPRLKYDSLEPYYADSAELWTAAPGQRLVRADGRANPGALGLSDIGPTYPDGEAADEDDLIEAADEEYSARYRTLRTARPDLRNVIYGRAVRQAGDLWLQYWFFYFLNDYQLAWGKGVHEGDWEMVQFRVPAGDTVPVDAVYAQHNFCEIRAWSAVELEEGHPVVYVGRGSHASFFGPGFQSTEFYDITDGKRWAKGATTLVDVSDPPAWLRWPGRWGGPRAGGAGPTAPCSHEQWDTPSALLKVAREREHAPAPNAPAIRVARRRGLLVIEFDASRLATPLARLIVTVNSTDDPNASPKLVRLALSGVEVGTLETRIALEQTKHYDIRIGTVDRAEQPGPAQIFLLSPEPTGTAALPRKLGGLIGELGGLAGKLVHTIRSLVGSEYAEPVPPDQI